eukprot:4314030-Amphidinium_carterae.1
MLRPTSTAHHGLAQQSLHTLLLLSTTTPFCQPSDFLCKVYDSILSVASRIPLSPLLLSIPMDQVLCFQPRETRWALFAYPPFRMFVALGEK